MRRGQRALGVLSAWLPVCAYTGLIWWLSSQDLSIKLIERVPLRDKGVHFLEYGALGALIAHAARVTWPQRPLRYVAAFWLTCGLGLVDELHQVYVPGRSADVNDLIADAAGAATTITLFVLATWVTRRRSAS